MDYETIVILLVIAANLVLVVLFFIAHSGSAGADPEIIGDGRKQIAPSKSLLWMGLLASIWTLIGVNMGVGGLMSERGGSGGLLIAAILIAMAGPFAVWMLIRYWRFRIVWDDKTIEVTGLRNDTRKYRWDDLLELAQRNHQTTVRDPVYPGVTPVRIFDIELRFRGGGIVRAAPNLVGYNAFVTDAAKHRDLLAQRQTPES